MQEKYQKYMTREQYMQLGYLGRQLVDYWVGFLPKMCEEMHRKGTFLQTVQKMDDELFEKHVSLIQSQVPLDAAQEIMNEEIYSLPPEE